MGDSERVVTKPCWRVCGESVIGASHVRKEQKKQDDIRWHPAEGAALPIIMALSDGHGSPKSFRSELGAKFAVETALKLLAPSEENKPRYDDPLFVRQAAEETLPRALVRGWRHRVLAHYEMPGNQFSPTEREALWEAESLERVAEVEADPVLAYGATLLVAVLTETFALYMQLGDGDILILSPEGQLRRPYAADPRLIANQTTSLCLPDAWQDFRFAFERFDSNPTSLILLATDGFSNSFADAEGFEQAGKDIWSLCQEGQWEQVTCDLKGWLEEASRVGSGDDITLGLLSFSPNQFKEFRSEETENDVNSHRISTHSERNLSAVPPDIQENSEVETPLRQPGNSVSGLEPRQLITKTEPFLRAAPDAAEDPTEKDEIQDKKNGWEELKERVQVQVQKVTQAETIKRTMLWFKSDGNKPE